MNAWALAAFRLRAGADKPALTFCLRMIFSEYRFPLFGFMR